jgi:aryl-alcohol dehydrogenase-like predicted oxidoreductase
MDAVGSVAEKEGTTPAQVALSWARNRPGVASVIIGARDLRQLGQNLGAADLSLDEESTELLDRVSQPRPNDYPYGPFGRKQVGRYIDSSAAVLGEVFTPAQPH